MTTINRAPFNALVDEPVGGDNTTGTVWNKDKIKTVLLDPIDAALANFSGPVVFPAAAIPSANPNTLDDYEEGTFTPTDQSGAGLVFTGPSGSPVGAYCKIGQMIFVAVNIIFPVTSNGSQAQIGGIPYPALSVEPYWGGAVTYTTSNLALTIMQIISSGQVAVFLTNGSACSNAQLSAHHLRFVAAYRTAT